MTVAVTGAGPAVGPLPQETSAAASDHALIQRIAAGDQQAMRWLFARHQLPLYRWLVRLVDDPALAEDLLSEVFLEIARQWDEMPVVAEVANQVRSSVQEPLAEVLDGLEHGIAREDLFDSLDRLASALLSVLRLSKT